MLFRTRSLRTQFSLVFAGLIVAFALLLSFLVERIAGARIEEKIGFELSELAFNHGDIFDRGMWSRQEELAVLTRLDVLRAPRDVAAIQQLLDHLHREIPIFTWVGFLDPQGRVLAATEQIIVGSSLAHRPVFQAGIAGPFVGDVHEAVMLAPHFPTTGEPLRFVDLSFPVRDQGGALVGVLASHLSFDWAREIERSLVQALRTRRQVDLFILGADGSRRLGPPDRAETPPAAFLAEARERKSGWSVVRWSDGETYLVGYSLERGHQTYPGMGWLFLAREPLREAYAPLRELETAILLLGGVLALLFALLAGMISGRVARPLEAIATAADRLRTGEGEQFPRVTGSSEILRLSASLRRLLEALSHSESHAGAMEAKASRDALTGLANRHGLQGQLDRLLPRVAAEGRRVICFCLDLDGFKPVNDTYGHAIGDAVLREVAGRLSASMRAEDTVVRLGGDEFLVLTESSPELWYEDSVRISGRIVAELSQPYRLDGCEIRIGCSIGVACWPVHAEEFTITQDLADDALYAAKRKGKRRAVIHGEPLPA